MQNPLESYRRTQRELRLQFDAFTRANCPTCPTPCCRRPARILPTDILLAEATGWRAHVGKGASTPSGETPNSRQEAEASGSDMASMMAGRVVEALNDPPASGEGETDGLPCEFLGVQGCSFPKDLRPFGCTTFLCRYMHARLDRPALTRIKRLVRELEEKHQRLLQSLRSAR